jgi:mRNA-degrading endonuclease toxin of MazEF toxin-antitoxin module
VKALPAFIRLNIVVLFALIVSVLAFGIVYDIHYLLSYLKNIEKFLNSKDANIYEHGLLSGIGFILLFLNTIFTPLVWRKNNSPLVLRTLALFSVQFYLIAIAIIPLWSKDIRLLVIPISFILTLGWARWQRRWRGGGVAPSLLTGILRPMLAPGQIWFAYIQGSQQSKTRPVIILKPISNKHWLVAYCTTQEPKSHYIDQYYFIEIGKLRGIAKENWVNTKDMRALQRGSFRSYTGLMQEGLYKKICLQAGIEPEMTALTIDEEYAGRDRGPFEKVIRQSLGIYSANEAYLYLDEDILRDNLALFFKNLFSFKKKN